MVGNWQGPASFEAVLKEAAIRAEAQNNRAEEVRRRRSEELQELARQIDDKLDKRRNRGEVAKQWERHHDVIVRLTEEGLSTFEIANELSNLGFYVDRTNVYNYQVLNGLREKENNPYNHHKKVFKDD